MRRGACMPPLISSLVELIRHDYDRETWRAGITGTLALEHVCRYSCKHGVFFTERGTNTAKDRDTHIGMIGCAYSPVEGKQTS